MRMKGIVLETSDIKCGFSPSMAEEEYKASFTLRETAHSKDSHPEQHRRYFILAFARL